MFKKSSLSVLFACHYPIDVKTLYKIKLLSTCLPFIDFSFYTTIAGYVELDNNDKSNLIKEFTKLKLSGELLDFSRYSEFLELTVTAENIMLINDTLGSGRKFNFGLWIYLFISCILIHLKIITIAAPVDRDQYRSWICPYFIIGQFTQLKKMNWQDWKSAKRNLTYEELCNIDTWLIQNWRSRKNAPQVQIDAKKKTLILERCLMDDVTKASVLFSFSRRNPLRWLNSII